MEIGGSSPGPNSYDDGVAIFNVGAGVDIFVIKKVRTENR